MLQQAPDVIAFDGSAPGNSGMDLWSLTDNMVGYRLSTIDAVVESSVHKQPTVTISRRPETLQNGATKYTIKAVHPVFDLVGQRSAAFLISADVVVPSKYVAHADQKMEGVMDAVAAILSSELLKVMAAEGAFLR